MEYSAERIAEICETAADAFTGEWSGKYWTNGKTHRIYVRNRRGEAGYLEFQPGPYSLWDLRTNKTNQVRDMLKVAGVWEASS